MNQLVLEKRAVGYTFLSHYNAVMLTLTTISSTFTKKNVIKRERLFDS